MNIPMEYDIRRVYPSSYAERFRRLGNLDKNSLQNSKDRLLRDPLGNGPRVLFASQLTDTLRLSSDEKGSDVLHPEHIHDHTPLLTRIPFVRRKGKRFTPDAIFMPVLDKGLRTFPFENPIYRMEQALRCMENLQAKRLIILYSGDYPERYIKSLQKYVEYANIAGQQINPEKISVINLPKGYQLPGLKLQTEGMDFQEKRTNDVHIKRNIALALSKMLNLKHVMFLDDDIVLPPFQAQQEDIPTQTRFEHFEAQLAHAFQNPDTRLVGSAADGILLRDEQKLFADKLIKPDNSLLCLVNRILGNPQNTFIGGGAMSIKIADDLPFFPNIYNEDWLFMASLMAKEPSSVFKISNVLHWDNTGRLRLPSSGGVIREEFPDIFAEGVLRAVKLSREYGPGTREVPVTFERIITDPDYWKTMVRFRLRFIDKLQRQFERYTAPTADLSKDSNPLSRIPVEQRDELIRLMGEVLKLAKAVVAQNQDIWPMLLTRYANTWLADQMTWRNWYKNLPSVDSLAKTEPFNAVLETLNLKAINLNDEAKEEVQQ